MKVLDDASVILHRSFNESLIQDLSIFGIPNFQINYPIFWVPTLQFFCDAVEISRNALGPQTEYLTVWTRVLLDIFNINELFLFAVFFFSGSLRGGSFAWWFAKSYSWIQRQTFWIFWIVKFSKFRVGVFYGLIRIASQYFWEIFLWEGNWFLIFWSHMIFVLSKIYWFKIISKKTTEKWKKSNVDLVACAFQLKIPSILI